MIACSRRHTSPLCGSPRIAGSGSVRRALGALVAAASELRLVEGADAVDALAAVELGMSADRVGEEALASALERLSSGPRNAAAHGQRVGIRLAPPPDEATDHEARRPLRPRAAGRRMAASQAAPSAMRSPVARGRGTTGGVRGPRGPAPPLPWEHLGAAALDLDGATVAGLSPPDPAGFLRADRSWVDRPAELRGHRASAAPAPGPEVVFEAPEVGPGSEELTRGRPDGGHAQPASRREGPPSAKGLTALVQLWNAEEGSGPGTSGPSPTSTLRVASDRADGPGQLDPAGDQRPVDDHAPAPSASTSFAPLGESEEAADLHAEGLVLELLERALRSEARRHGVVLEWAGLP